MQMLILAGGLGSRLRPLTERLPKCMVPAGGKPFLEHQLQLLAEQGHFHHLAWSPEDGFIMRSADHDDRNKVKPLSYTSLILDAFPR